MAVDQTGDDRSAPERPERQWRTAKGEAFLPREEWALSDQGKKTRRPLLMPSEPRGTRGVLQSDMPHRDRSGSAPGKSQGTRARHHWRRPWKRLADRTGSDAAICGIYMIKSGWLRLVIALSPSRPWIWSAIQCPGRAAPPSHMLANDSALAHEYTRDRGGGAGIWSASKATARSTFARHKTRCAFIVHCRTDGRGSRPANKKKGRR